MDYNILLDRLKNNSYNKLNLIYGDETYLIDKALQKFKETVVSQMPELNCILLSGEKLKPEDLSDACDTFPMLSKKKLVIVRDFTLLKNSGKPEEDDSAKSKDKSIEDYLEAIENQNDSTVLVFVTFGEVDKRKKFFNLIKKNGDLYDIKRVEYSELSKWVKGLLKQNGKSIGLKEVSHFIDISGYYDKNTKKTLYDLENEIKKLSSFMNDEKEIKEISMEIIDELAPKNIENDIFKLINACSDKDAGESIRIYNDLLLLNEPSLRILSMISNQIKNIMLTKELLSKHMDSKSISTKLKIHEFTAKNCVKYASKIDSAIIRKAFEKCIQAELNIKSGKMNDRLTLELLFVNLFD